MEEARITGQLDHPGIPPVHELGCDKSGRPFFTMPLIRGHDFQEILLLADAGDAEWSTTRVVRVLLQACEAVAYAHAKGAVHRDLKPANIMVGRFGEVFVLDWGLAKVLGRADAGHDTVDLSASTVSFRVDPTPDPALLTHRGDVVGTPAYMSPEQARGELDLIGEASDVYSLGAILYRILTGTKPYSRLGERPSSSEVLARALRGPPKPVLEVAPQAPPELAAICHKAMKRAAEDRYANARAMSEDLRAYLEGRVVSAHRTGTLVRLGKWVRRNRAVTAAIAGSGLVALSAFAWNRHVRAETVRGLRAYASHSIAQEDPALALLLALTVARREDSYLANTALLEALDHNRLSRLFPRHDGPAFTPDGKAIALWDAREAVLRVWDLDERRWARTWDDLPGEGLRAQAFSPDGEYLASLAVDGSLSLLATRDDRSRHAQVQQVSNPSRYLFLAIDRSSTWLAASPPRGPPVVFAIPELVPHTKLAGEVGLLAETEPVFDPAGKRLLAITDHHETDAAAYVWDVNSGRQLLTLEHERPLSWSAWHPSGEKLATACVDGSLRLFDAATGTPIGQWDVGEGRTFGDFSPNW